MCRKKLMWVNLPLILMIGMSANVSLADGSGGSGTGGATGPVLVAKAEPKKGPILPPNLCDAAKIPALKEANDRAKSYSRYHHYKQFLTGDAKYSAANGRYDQCVEYAAYSMRAFLLSINKENEQLLKLAREKNLAAPGVKILNDRLSKLSAEVTEKYGRSALQYGCIDTLRLSLSIDGQGKAKLEVDETKANFEGSQGYWQPNPDNHDVISLDLDLTGNESTDLKTLADAVKHDMGRRITKGTCLRVDNYLTDVHTPDTCIESSDIKYALVHHWQIPESCVYPEQYSGTALASQIKKDSKATQTAGADSTGGPSGTAVVAK